MHEDCSGPLWMCAAQKGGRPPFGKGTCGPSSGGSTSWKCTIPSFQPTAATKTASWTPSWSRKAIIALRRSWYYYRMMERFLSWVSLSKGALLSCHVISRSRFFSSSSIVSISTSFSSFFFFKKRRAICKERPMAKSKTA